MFFVYAQPATPYKGKHMTTPTVAGVWSYGKLISLVDTTVQKEQ
jgi:hypothetical protein